MQQEQPMMEDMPTLDPFYQKRRLLGAMNFVSLVLFSQILFQLLLSKVALRLIFLIRGATLKLAPQLKPSDIQVDYLIYTAQSLFSLVSMLVIPWILVKLTRRKQPKLIGFEMLLPKNLAAIGGGSTIALGYNFLLSYVSALLIFLLSKVGLRVQDLNLDLAKNANMMSTVAYYVAICVVAPLAEEYLCRGVILHALKPFGNGFAIFTSALVFSLMHGNLHQIPGSFGGGLVMGYFAVKYNSLMIPVGIHMVNNIVASTLGASTSETAQVIMGVVAILLMIRAAVHFVKLLKSKEDRAMLAACEVAVTHKGKLMFQSIGFVIFLLFSLYTLLKTFR